MKLSTALLLQAALLALALLANQLHHSLVLALGALLLATGRWLTRSWRHAGGRQYRGLAVQGTDWPPERA